MTTLASAAPASAGGRDSNALPAALPAAGYESHPLPPGTPWQRLFGVAVACAVVLAPALLAAALRSLPPPSATAAGVGQVVGRGPLFALFFAVGAIGGVLAGLLGVGGAVVLLPLLTGLTGISLKEASNVTIVQVVAAALVGVGTYYRRRLIHVRPALIMGGASLAGGLLGGYGSAALPSIAIESLFLVVVGVAVALLFIPVAESAAADGTLPFVEPLKAAGLGLCVGTLAGLLGAGGGFLIVPLLIGALRFPTRLAIGTSPAVIVLGSAAALVGKAVSHQVQVLPAVAVVAGAMPFTYLGARLSHRLSPRALRLLLVAVLIAIAAHGATTLAQHVANP